MLVGKQLVRKKGRTLLTLLGVAMGVALLVSITSYSAGLKEQIQQTVTKRFDLVIQSKGASSPLASRLTRSEYDQLKSIEAISDSPAVVLGAVRTDPIPYFLLAGVSSLEPLLGNLNLIEGRLLRYGQPEVLMGQQALKRFKVNVGDTIDLQGEKFFITGSYMTGGRFFDQAALLDMDNAQRLLKRSDSVNFVLVRVQPGHHPAAIMKQIQSRLPQLNIIKSRDLLGEIRMFLVVDQIAWGMSIIALIISAVFVINTLIMSVSERTKEIGILMALGWSRRMIVGIVFWESVIVCLIGGAAGILGGWLLLWLSSRSDITGLDWTAATLPAGAVGWAIGLALVLGVVSAIYPAIVASRLTPAQALRYE